MRVGSQECRTVVWSLTRSKALKTYIRDHQVRKLQIGTGYNVMPGWLNTDGWLLSPKSVFLDATKPFPFPECTFHYVFSEHLIEHLTYTDGLFMLRESYRVMMPGGRIRIATPNLENFIALYTPDKSDLQRKYIKWTSDVWLPEIGEYGECYVINNFCRNWGHVFIYDRATLQRALEQAGFTNIGSHGVGDSHDENLRGLECHGEIIGEEMNRFETMVLEAERPG